MSVFWLLIALVADGAYIQLVSMVPGLTAPFALNTYADGYVRITWIWTDKNGYPIIPPSKDLSNNAISTRCINWMTNATLSSTQLNLQGNQQASGNPIVWPNPPAGDHYESVVAGYPLGGGGYAAQPGVYLRWQFQCAYSNETNYPPPGVATSDSNLIDMEVLWAATPNTPPLTLTEISASQVNVTYIHDALVQGYANTNYYLEYSVYSNFSSSTVVPYPASRLDTSANQIQTFTFLPAQLGFLYYFRIRAFNGFIYSAYSNTETFIAANPPMAATGISVSVTNLTTLSVSWAEPTVLGGVSNRNVQCSTNPSFQAGVIEAATASPFAFTNLAVGTTYYCSVELINAAGNTGFTNAPAGVLLALPPNPPTLPTFTVQTNTSVLISWQNNGTENGAAIDESKLEYKVAGPGPYTPITVPAPATSYLLNSLVPTTNYVVRVSSHNVEGFGNPSSPDQPYTQAGRPTITNVTYTGDLNPSPLIIGVGTTQGGQAMVITGVSFILYGTTVVTYGGFSCAVQGEPLDTSLTCLLQAGVGQDLTFVVTSGSVASIPSLEGVTYPAPTITSHTLSRPNTPPMDPLPALSSTSEPLVFQGTNFGSMNTEGSVSVMYGPVSAGVFTPKYQCSIVTLFDTNVTCLTTATTDTVAANIRNLHFQITVGGQVSAYGADRYNYPITPIISSVSGCPGSCPNANATCDCPTRGNIPLTFIGSYFTNPLRIQIRGVDCTGISFINDSAVTCTLPEGTGGIDLLVTGAQGTLTSNPDPLVSYAKPSLISASGCTMVNGAPHDCNRTAEDQNVTITGTDFGNIGAIIFVGGVLCADSYTISHEEVICTIPASSGLDRVLSVLQFEGDLSVTPNVSINYALCTPGTYPNDTQCPQCNPGTYSFVAGQLACSLCPVGNYSNTAGSSNCPACLKGFYQNSPGQQGCLSCQPGSYTPDNRGYQQCIVCSVGTFANTSNSSGCLACPRGFFQNSTNQTFCYSCQPGYYTPDDRGYQQCTACDSGQFAQFANMSSCNPCQAGYHQDFQGQSFCSNCTPGYYSLGNTKDCLGCPAGRFSNTSHQALCTACPDGTYQANQSQSMCDDCLPGYYKTYDFYVGSPLCFVCPAGYFSNKSGASICDSCAPGSAQATPGQTNCTLCDLGQYQSLPGKIDCLECDSGFYAGMEGQPVCFNPPEGYFAQRRDNGTKGAVNYSACVPGTTSTSDFTACTDCPSGRFNPFYGHNCSYCAAGNYTALAGQKECSECGPGLFSNFDGATICFDCSEGYFSGAGEFNCTPCAGGTVAGTRAATHCTPCSKGSYAPIGSFECLTCPTGKFSGDKAPNCTDCHGGTWNPNTNQSECLGCGAGLYAPSGSPACLICNLGNISSGANSTTCTQCPAGSFINNTAQTACFKCEPGYFSNTSGSGSCLPCTPGNYSGTQGNLICLQCPSKYFAQGYANTECHTCGKGYVVNRQQTGCLDDYWEEPSVIGFYSFLGAAGLGTLVLTAASLIYLRENRLIHYSGPPFMWTILAGMALVWASVILWIVHQTPALCHLRNVFLNIGTAVILMCVTTKTWRLHRIFNRHKEDALKTVVIKDSTLFAWIVAFVGWDILVLAVWWGVAMFSVDSLQHKCISLWEPWVHIALWFWKPFVVIFLIYLCVKVRDIDERFNESWWIGIGIYNVVVVLALFLILTLTLPLRPREWYIMFDTVIAYLVGTTWAGIFLPKYYQIYRKKHENEELFGTEIASDINEAEVVAEEEKHDEVVDAEEKKKGVNPDKGDDALTKLHIKRDKKAKELNKLLKIVERTKQRMKTDITNLNHLSSDVLALHQEIEYRKKLLNKKGVVVSNKPSSKPDLEMTPAASSHDLQSGGGGGGDAGTYTGAASPSKPEPYELESGADNSLPHLAQSSQYDAQSAHYEA